jgi:hypothetical protein
VTYDEFDLDPPEREPRIVKCLSCQMRFLDDEIDCPNCQETDEYREESVA